MNALKLEKELKKLKNKGYEKKALYFFKCGKGQYGEGDQFLGIPVPKVRQAASAFESMPLGEIKKALESKWHEVRAAALFILVVKFQKGSVSEREKIVDFYIKNTKGINNWDLVDLSAYKILGEWLKDKKDRKILYTLAASGSLWKERIAVVSTYALIKQKEFKEIFDLSEKFLTHKHDLMHKACGWMLREAGKMDEKALLQFLERFAPKMPRTALRYAIEKLSLKLRSKFMKAK